MDILEAVTFVFREKDFSKKIGIASLWILLIPLFGVGSIPIIGWGVEIIRRMMRGNQQVLPDWSTFKPYASDGLKCMLPGFLWGLPFLGALTLGVLSSRAGSLQPWFALLIWLLALLWLFLLPGLLLQVAQGQPFRSLLNPINAARLLVRKPGLALLTGFLTLITPSVFAVIGLLFCVIGVLPAMSLGWAFSTHLIGQYARRAGIIII